MTKAQRKQWARDRRAERAMAKRVYQALRGLQLLPVDEMVNRRRIDMALIARRLEPARQLWQASYLNGVQQGRAAVKAWR